MEKENIAVGLDIGTTKTTALMDLILERRDEANIRLFEKRIEELTELELKEINDCLIIDCRDKLNPLPEQLKDILVQLHNKGGNE